MHHILLICSLEEMGKACRQDLTSIYSHQDPTSSGFHPATPATEFLPRRNLPEKNHPIQLQAYQLLTEYDCATCPHYSSQKEQGLDLHLSHFYFLAGHLYTNNPLKGLLSHDHHALQNQKLGFLLPHSLRLLQQRLLSDIDHYLAKPSNH